MTWIGVSIALSVVLTIALNIWVRMFPNAARRVAREVTESSWTSSREPGSSHRVRVWAPWKAMILGSLILTILLNLVLWITRN